MATRTRFEIDGATLSVSNLDKVLYPEVGFTKGEVIDYYVRIAPVMLTHVGDRGVTLKRFPDGVEGGSFFEKRCAKHRPDFVATAAGPGDRGGAIQYCVLADRPSLAWAANMAALELHSPMARAADIETPTLVVFDLDPGAPATMEECCQVALDIEPVLSGLGLRTWAKTSGSKGLQLYVPLNTTSRRSRTQPASHEGASKFAKAVAETLAKHHPERVVSVQRKELRKGKVLIDWSQNSRHKTTIGAYSLRARPRPTVSTPITWDEVAAGADGEPLVFEAHDVLDRVDEHGDLFAGTATLQQELPANP